MIWRLLTNLTVGLHSAFIVFVVLGGVLARRYRWLIPIHLLTVAWAVYVEARPGIICPLTPLENQFAMRAGEAGYSGGFVDHYLIPIIYPDGLTRVWQWALASVVAAVNLLVYGWPRSKRQWASGENDVR
jgi:Protein of Unknown function (DUF2784)